jgi:hypothetical protein
MNHESNTRDSFFRVEQSTQTQLLLAAPLYNPEHGASSSLQKSDELKDYTASNPSIFMK